MGPNPDVQVDIEGPFPIQPGDTFLLCSDGLTGRVKDTEIGQILTCLAPSEAVQALIHLANLRGGPDNITVVVVRVTAPQRLEADGRSCQAFENGQHKPRSVHALVWTVLGMLVLGAALSGMLRQLIPAGICLVLAAMGAAGAIVYRYTSPGTNYFDSRLRGKGPYRQTLCSPDMAFVGLAKDLVNQLHEAAEKEAWPVDWGPYHDHRNAAVAAVTTGDMAEAGRQFFRAVIYMMGQLKRRKDLAKDADRAAGLF